MTAPLLGSMAAMLFHVLAVTSTWRSARYYNHSLCLFPLTLSEERNIQKGLSAILEIFQ